MALSLWALEPRGRHGERVSVIATRGRREPYLGVFPYFQLYERTSFTFAAKLRAEFYAQDG